jgi:hypothetical protein
MGVQKYQQQQKKIKKIKKVVQVHSRERTERGRQPPAKVLQKGLFGEKGE